MNNRRKIITLVPTLLLVVSAVLAYTKKQDIYDWLSLRNYDAPSSIVQLSEDTSMSELGRKIFYVYHPVLSDKTAFNETCRAHGEQTIVLGCFDGIGIFVYNVDDPRLDGILQVTSAHEMLHAVYQRMSKSEKASIDALVEADFKKVTNERIISLVEKYRDTDAANLPSELHSILGTEVSTLSSDLEKHYAKYFNDRAKLVSYSERYEAVFSELKNHIEATKAEIAIKKQQIEILETDLKSRNTQLVSQRSQLDSTPDSQKDESYNAEVRVYNAQVDRFNSSIAHYQQLINDHNALIEALQADVLTQQDLVSKIDSNFQTISN